MNLEYTKFDLRGYFGSSQAAMDAFNVTEMTISRWQKEGVPRGVYYEIKDRFPDLFATLMPPKKSRKQPVQQAAR